MQGTPAALASDYVKPKRIILKKHPVLNEKRIQELIWDDPQILGLGDLAPLGKEVSQPTGGRLDLLFAKNDGESEVHFEVEVQLGATDPSHIIRTIEYWDLHRTRNREVQHVAVLIAEDITSRFLNVISLLNKSISIIAIQMQALQVGDKWTLVFTKVLDLFTLPYEDQIDSPAPVTRDDWKKAQAGLLIVDDLFEFVKTLDPEFELRYNQGFIQINKSGSIFLAFNPTKRSTKIRIRMDKTTEVEDLRTEVENDGVQMLYEEAARGGFHYVLIVDNDKFKDHAASIKKLVGLGYQDYRSNW